MLDWPEACLLMLGGVTALVMLGPPVAFAFLAINIVGAYLFLGGEPGLKQFIRSGISGLNSFSLTPIPFFVLMGEVLFHSGLALKAIDAVDGLIRRVPGRLAVVAVVAGTLFSAISGSTIATTAMLGSLLLPQMLKRGYEPRMAVGPIIAIGGVDMLIPPSALAVLLGSLAGISISGLLLGGILPGLILAVLFVGFIVVSCTLDPSRAPRDDGPATSGSPWRALLVDLVPLVLIFAVVVGGIVRGWATPTESGALGAAATLVVAALYRSLSLAVIGRSMMGMVAISGSILFILFGAFTFSQILNFSGATNGLVELTMATALSPRVLVAIMMLILLVLGCFLDQVSIMMITLPFFMPMLQGTGVDLVWFGILYLIAMQIGLLTPPFGLLLFVMQGVSPPHITLPTIYRAAMPYVFITLLVMVALFFWPPLATLLPSMVR